jgi:translation initiation factor IF-3
VRRFLEDGDKVKLVVQFRGREIVHPETGRAVLERVCKDVADVATVTQIASMEGNRLNMILAPKPKRGGQARPEPRPTSARTSTSGEASGAQPTPSPTAQPAVEP